MSSSIISLLMTSFIPSIFLLFLIPIITATNSSSSIIQEACSNTQANFDSKLCLQILQSEPKIVSAPDFLVLSIRIMESGISNATNTQIYLESMLNGTNLEPNLKSAIQACKLSYDSVIMSFTSALGEVKNDREYQTATYDLLIGSTDYIEPCKDAVASKKIRDGIILSGNKVVPIFGLSAYEAVMALLQPSTTPHTDLS